MIHADDGRALLVDRRGVEIINRDIVIRANGVRHRTRVFRKLPLAQVPDILDAFDRARLHVGRKLFVPEYGQALFQGELKPVLAGDAIARPVVEIFVPYNPLDALEIYVGGRVGPGQDILGIEDVQGLVFHCAHIEIIGGDNVVNVEVIFQIEPFLIPTHGIDERLHSVITTVNVFLFHVDPQRDVSAAACKEMVFDMGQVSGNQRKQVRGLGKGIFPPHPVPAFTRIATFGGITIRQQYRKPLPIRLDGHRVTRHHIGPVRKPGDLSEPFCLTLGQ